MVNSINMVFKILLLVIVGINGWKILMIKLRIIFFYDCLGFLVVFCCVLLFNNVWIVLNILIILLLMIIWYWLLVIIVLRMLLIVFNFFKFVLVKLFNVKCNLVE